MPDNYNFNPAFNIEKLLAFTPPVCSSFSSLYSEMPDTETCLRELEKLCRQEKELPDSLFDKHIGENAIYSSKELLKDGLKLIYCCFIDKDPAHQLSDDRRSQLVDLLTQDIDACTAGFHNRVNLVLDQLTQPENLEQLLYNGREFLAAAMTEEMLKVDKDLTIGRGFELHFGNRVRVIASQLGLGIKPILGTDPFHDQDWDIQIEKRLKQTFETYLTPFHLPTLFTDQIKNLLLSSGYNGFKKEGYGIDLVDELMLMLRKFMPSLCANKNDDYLRQRYLQIETDKDAMPYIGDINWSILKQDFYQVLKEEGYFKKLPMLCSLIDVIEQCILFNNWEDFGVHYKTLEQAFPSHLTSGGSFGWSIQGLAIEQRTVVFEACKDLPFIVEKSDQLIGDILKNNNKIQTLNQKKQEQFFSFIHQYNEIERKSKSIMQGMGKFFFKKISQEKKSILESILHNRKYILKINKIRKDRQYYHDDLVEIKNYLNNLESTITSDKINILKCHRGFFKLHDTTSDKLVIEFKATIAQLKQEIESTIPKEPIIKPADLVAAFHTTNNNPVDLCYKQ